MTYLPTILRLLALAAAGYALLCALVYAMQERLIFFPERDPPGTRYAFGVPAEEQLISVEGARLHALLFHAPEPRGIILYLHGNAGSLRSSSWPLVVAAPRPVRAARARRAGSQGRRGRAPQSPGCRRSP